LQCACCSGVCPFGFAMDFPPGMPVQRSAPRKSLLPLP
jgi:heterodisulfide reductase subunit C